jgi:hypothetical protein
MPMPGSAAAPRRRYQALGRLRGGFRSKSSMFAMPPDVA